MRELRLITDALRDGFERHGYGEVWTPALEYESVLARADVARADVAANASGSASARGSAPARAGVAEAAPAYRLIDESGLSLALRSDMTVPIARLVSTRYADAELPLRFFYLAHCYRRVRPQRGQSRELLQAGIELIGAEGPEGTVEALTVLCRTLDGAGLKDYRVGLGDASLFKTLMERMDVPQQLRGGLLDALAMRDFVMLERTLGQAGLPTDVQASLLEVSRSRGGLEVLEHAPGPVADAVAGMREVGERLPADVAARVIFDLGLVRNIGYYTGAVFEVYDPALGAPIGGGGRYDELLGRFGRPLPAVGFALGLERLHIALAGEERGTGAMLR